MEKFKKNILPLFAFAVIILSACCKANCVANIIYLDFTNYQEKEFDTIIYSGYERGSNFTLLKTTSRDIKPFIPNDTTRVLYYNPSLEINLDWLIKIVRSGKTYQITDYKTVQDRCGCGNGKYEVLTSYSVNGVAQNSPYLKLSK